MLIVHYLLKIIFGSVGRAERERNIAAFGMIAYSDAQHERDRKSSSEKGMGEETPGVLAP